MAMMQIDNPDRNNNPCPRCGEEALIIKGTYVKWMKCPSCRFTKLMGKERDSKIAVVSLIHPEKPKTPKLRVVEE